MLRPHRFDEEIDPGPVQIQARKVHFELSEIPLEWIPGHPVASTMINLFNVVLPAAEHWFVKTFNEALPLARSFSGGRLLHGDLQSGHIFHRPGKGYQAMIDFGAAQAGDPRWDLARVLLWDGDAALDALLAGYGDDLLTQDDRDFLLPLYLFSFAVYCAVGHSMPDYIRLLLNQSRYAALL